MLTLSLYSLACNPYIFSVSQFLVKKFDCSLNYLLYCLSLLRIEMFSIRLKNRIASFNR